MEFSDMFSLPGALRQVEHSMLSEAPRCGRCKKKVERARIYQGISQGDFRLKISCHGTNWIQEFNVSGMESSEALQFIREQIPKELFGGPWKCFERYATTTKPERRRLP